MCPKWSIMCTNLPLYAIIAPLCTFITKKKKISLMLKQEYKTHQMLFSDYCIYYSTSFLITLQQISVFVSHV